MCYLRHWGECAKEDDEDEEGTRVMCSRRGVDLLYHLIMGFAAIYTRQNVWLFGRNRVGWAKSLMYVY